MDLEVEIWACKLGVELGGPDGGEGEGEGEGKEGGGGENSPYG